MKKIVGIGFRHSTAQNSVVEEVSGMSRLTHTNRADWTKANS